MSSDRHLKVVAGRGDEACNERIVLSLVHPRGRVDIPAGAIVRIEARDQCALPEQGTGALLVIRRPYVHVCVTQPIRDRICELTSRIVDEPMEIVVDGECVSRPIVREPLCSQESFSISAGDITEARVLAHRLRTGTKAGPRPI